jgi:hypothetical protein
MIAALVLAATPGLARASESGASRTLAPQRRAEVVHMADIVADALKFRPNGREGRVSLDQNRLAGLDGTQVKLVKKLVADINNKSIGISVVAKDGSVSLYGNPKALTGAASIKPKGQTPPSTRGPLANAGPVAPMNSAWVDWFGVHIYIDGWWAEQLTWLNGWAVSTIAGMIVANLCGTGAGCLAASAVVAWLWDQVIWQFLRRYYPQSFTIHAPWWGYVYLQPWRSGAWYNGWWIWTWLWT